MKLVSECESKNCELFEFRFGKNPYQTQSLREEQIIERETRL
jgi:hypothetical protein